MSFGELKYYESYDSGITFLSMTNEAQANTLQDDFFSILKTNLQKLSVFHSRYSFSDFFTIIRKKEDSHSYIEIRHTAEKASFAEITLPCTFLSDHSFPSYLQSFGDDDFLLRMDYNGIVTLQMGSVSFPYSNDSRFAPGSLIIQANPQNTNEDDLPFTAKSLNNAVSTIAPHITYDTKKESFSIPEKILYGGLCRQNLLSRFIDYLNEKFLDFLSGGRPEDYRIFPEDIEKRFCELTRWHTWSNEHRSFMRTNENGDIIEKRPADFLHCLLITIQNGKFLLREDEETIQDTHRKVLTTLFDILADLFKDREHVLSAEQSLAEYRDIMENEGQDPLQKMQDIHESCMNIATGEFAFYLLLARKIYAQMDLTRAQLPYGKCDSFFVRKSSGQKGLGMEDYAIVLNEVSQNGAPLCYDKKITAFENAIHQSSTGFSLMRITEELQKCPSPTDCLSCPANQKIFLTHFQEFSQLTEYYNSFNQMFGYHSFITAINHSFNDPKFKLSHLVYVRNILRLQKKEFSKAMQQFPANALPYDLNVALEDADQTLQVKQEIKQSILDATKDKAEKTFNFALAIFGAFGVASSIVSILLSDSRSMGISVITMLVYLTIVAISYHRWDR